MKSTYPRPKETGGKLIRQVIASFKANGVARPLKKNVVLAVSGGVDSVALAVLVCRYGRKLVAKDQISILHINHQWRGKKSDNDAKAVQKLALKLGASYLGFKLDPDHLKKGESPENSARKERKRVFLEVAQNQNAVVFTAHQADEVAETMLWRIFTGAFHSQQVGIRFREGNEIRPFLNVRKENLYAFLKEENIKIKEEDATNFDAKYLRGKMRSRLIPALKEVFPKAVEHLIELQNQNVKNLTQDMSEYSNGDSEMEFIKNWMKQITESHQLRLKRPHFQPTQSMNLPKGWKLRVETVNEAGCQKPIRWILEKS